MVIIRTLATRAVLSGYWSPVMNNPPKVFISHAKVDRVHAERLAQLLLANGVMVWYDDWEMLVGHKVYESVYEGILACDYLALVITGDALRSSWVNEELSLMRQRQLEDRQVRVLPLLFEEVELPLNLRNAKYADFREFERGFAHLMRTLGQVMTPMDEHVLETVRNAVREEALGVIAEAKEVRTQAAKRLLNHSGQRRRVESPAAADDSFVSVEVAFTSTRTRLPMRLWRRELLEDAMTRVLKLLDMYGALGAQRLGYFFVRDGIPLRSDDSVEAAALQDGDVLQIGYYAYALE